jgi:hypothetical protein
LLNAFGDFITKNETVHHSVVDLKERGCVKFVRLADPYSNTILGDSNMVLDDSNNVLGDSNIVSGD